MAEAPETLLDRRSGRSQDEFGLESDLTFAERVERFESAEYSFGYAETQMNRGYSKEEVYGETREIQEALEIFRDSAEFHASRIKESEIVAALENNQIDPGIADAIRDRQRDAQKRTRMDDAINRAMERYSGDEQDLSGPHEERYRDDEQER